jgi:23S rRNA (cytosine1962-C5)-methyltransferase
VPNSSSDRGGDEVAVSVTERGRARILARHPWLFRQDVARGPATDAGDGGPAIVRVVDARGHLLGFATWAARAKIALRMLSVQEKTQRDEAPPLPTLRALVQARLVAARARRGGVAMERDALRIVHGESDNLPGLFIDVYADVAVVQTTSVAMDAALAEIAPLIQADLKLRLVVERNDGSARDFEGLPRRRQILCGEGPTVVTYRLGPNQLEADLMEDGKTGGFLDQADNHATVAALAPRGASALDAFTYHGGFALALARRGGAVHANDEDARAVQRTRANASANDLGNLRVTQGNAFDLLRQLEAEGKSFDVVVVDPPALAKRKSEAGAADRAYKELVLRGFRLTNPGGLTVACSCSGRMSRDRWDEIVAEAAADAGRRVQVLARLGAGRDHPELLGVPETAHLKCWIMRLI